MSNAISAPPILSGEAHPPSVSFRELWPWALFGAALFALALYVVGSYQGSATLHELVHDGRHLLGFPCH